MTKRELRDYLKAGCFMDDVFIFGPGQDCEIFKAEKFQSGEQIIYIPDVYLNTIPRGTCITDDETIDEVVGNCYTGDDFIEECGGNLELAEHLFRYCDWQHPSSALPEIEDEEGQDDTGKRKLPRHLQPWMVCLCETVYDITLNAQNMIASGQLEVGDSRELFSSILQWAIEFEREHPGPWEQNDHSEDYMDLVDEFAREKLTQSYGRRK